MRKELKVKSTPFVGRGKGIFTKAAKLDVRGKPCPPGYNAERDDCIPTKNETAQDVSKQVSNSKETNKPEPKYNTDAHARFKKKVSEAVKSKSLALDNPRIALRIKSIIGNAIGNMNKTAAERLDENVNDFFFYDNPTRLTKKINNIKELTGNTKTEEGYAILGCFIPMLGAMCLTIASKDRRIDERIITHEMSHAIDGSRHEFSESDEWKSAWKEEISNNQVNEYASSSMSEGFAEFGSLLLCGAAALKGSAEMDTEMVKSKFPKCFEFWKSRDLI